jgi:type III secretory pathway component EscR
MSEQRHSSRTKNLTFAGLSALTGCVSLVIVVVALLVGLYIDSRLGQRGPATICLVTLSVPISLFVMVKIALTLIGQIQPANFNENEAQSQSKED